MQRGSVIQMTRKNGPGVWQFRWSDKDLNGRRVYHRQVIGTIDQYADEAAVRHATLPLIYEVNSRSPHDHVGAITVDQLCEHFEQWEFRSSISLRSVATIKTYRGYIRRWIRPQWGSRKLDEIKATDVEAWLRSLNLARGSRSKLRSILSILFNHACRHELFDHNPIRFVRQGAKRLHTPDVLTGSEIKLLVESLPLRERTLVLLAASTGLRQGEIFGLKWRDVDFEHGELNVIRSMVCGVVGACKTESSQRPVPLHHRLAAALLAWRPNCNFKTQDDWVFASRLHNGRKPYWGPVILRKYIQPAAQKLGIHKQIGWHTFRRTYATLLRSLGVEFKVMQELMRHSSLRTTLDVYTQAVGPAKRAAQAAVLSLFTSPEYSEGG
ncbi:tyrosine-type recombinase/integrase [Granulicella mallensis]|uniref:Integrase family protein n=1 Tax=Granulicella mallensis (strain ATCC BAA-1857 / DSM 23137 / MP5ACTX8) TaxID=682795 RepID=G8NUN5_GRAMM|nr:site-specific integrase [Granulicella mallensis]AEU36486.1 integrase family protein [Granulicella mallensis MP5ACTX8]